MSASASSLDFEELFHLALNAMETNNNEAAINYLKRAQEIQPDNASVTYLLGAVHAQIGLFERAIDEMTKAVSMDPSLDAAHFQLGLLHITSGHVFEAEVAWKPLDKLGDEHPFYLFKTGMLHLVKDEFAECVDYLKRGIQANNINEPLNKDMEKVLNAAQDALDKQNAMNEVVEKSIQTPNVRGGKHILLSAYGNDDDEEKKH